MKAVKILLILIIFAALVFGVYWFYQSFQKPPSVSEEPTFKLNEKEIEKLNKLRPKEETFLQEGGFGREDPFAPVK